MSLPSKPLALMFERVLRELGASFVTRKVELPRSKRTRRLVLAGSVVVDAGSNGMLKRNGKAVLLLINPGEESNKSRDYKFHTRECLAIGGMRTKGFRGKYETVERYGRDIFSVVTSFGRSYHLCKHCEKLERSDGVVQ